MTLPDEFHEICERSDGPIYACDHCRQNGTFDPSQYEWREVPPAATAPPKVKTDGILSDMDLWTRQMLAAMQNPVEEAFQRGLFGRGRPGMDNHAPD